MFESNQMILEQHTESSKRHPFDGKRDRFTKEKAAWRRPMLALD
jgi:hypothetical protein